MQAKLDNRLLTRAVARWVAHITKLAALGIGLVSFSHAEPLQLHLGPSYAYPVTTDIPSDVTMIPIEKRLDWLKVRVGEYSGWIHIDELEKVPHVKRPEPAQFRYSPDPLVQLELSASTESALGVAANFEMLDQDVSVRFYHSARNSQEWNALEFGLNRVFRDSEKWSWSGYLGAGVGLNESGSGRWSDEGKEETLPIAAASTEISWKIDHNFSVGARAQTQQALAGNSANHGALALVWKIRF